MTISSRTPEGTPNCCPLCGQAIRLEPSQPLGDAPCPACGSLLWFTRDSTGTRFFDTGATGLFDRLAGRLGLSPEVVRQRRFADLGLDSLEVVELVMALEESIE